MDEIADDPMLKPGQARPAEEAAHPPAIARAGAFAREEGSGGLGLVMAFSGTLFLSALLLFSVQPIFAKMLLPLLGGAPAVWNAAMLFYQAALLAGYAYAHWASRALPPKAHLVSHLALLALPALVLPFGIGADASPPTAGNPVPWLLLTMLAAIGLPFFVVSSTGPLLQRWFSRTGHPAARDPYFLYAASNLGSMLGLLSYPFLVEPRLRLTEQAGYWAAGYLALAVCIAGCSLPLLRSSWFRSGTASEPDGTKEALAWGRRLRWIALAFVPSSLMLGVTQYITTDVAAAPLLWVIPLGLYLLTFTIAFARRPLIPHRLTLLLMPVALGILVAVMTLNLTRPLSVAIPVHLAGFYLAALLCHGELAKDRPSVGHLTEFYLWMSVGGVLGGLFNALLAPAVFPLVIEYPLALAAAAMLYPGAWRAEGFGQRLFDFLAPAIVLGLMILALWLEKRYGMTSSKDARVMIVTAGVLGCLIFYRRPLRFGLAVGMMLAFGMIYWALPRDIVYVERSFFGVTRIEKSGTRLDLYHGTTLHGTQNREPGREALPLTYYFPTGPAGILLMNMPRLAGGTYGVVGLGAGSLVAYSRPGERWVFYEIDPVIARVAQNPRFYTYLRDARGQTDVVLGDARLSLQRSPEKFDALLLDAYSSDAVPVHLLTREAFRVYLDRLKPTGVLSLHISNKHLDLEPVVHELCRDAGLQSVRMRDMPIEPAERTRGKAPSDWVIAYRREQDVEAVLERGRWAPTKGRKGVELWTDDFSSIWTIRR
jgi:hypothetical protein